jgi:hypothetical protein
MKKHLSLLAMIIIFAMLKCNAQNEWAPAGAKWTYTETYFFSPRIDTLTIRSVGDTLIQGHNCKILKKSSFICDLRSLKEYMYSDNGKVFFYDHSRASFQMLYNFNAAVGDSIVGYPGEFPENDSITTIIDSISTITINSIDLKKLFVHYSSSAIFWTPASSSVIIEYIGDTYLMFPWTYGACDASWGGPLRCYEDPLTGFHNFETAPSCDYITTGIDETGNLFDKVYPNPARDYVVFERNGLQAKRQKQSFIQIVTVFGQVVETLEILEDKTVWVTEGVKPGVYFYKTDESGYLGKVVVVE